MKIKIAAFYLFFLMILSSHLSAQEFGFGLKAGLGYSTLKGDMADGESTSYKSGFHVGPSFSLKITDMFGIRAEFLYNQFGTGYEYSGPSYFVLRGASDLRTDVLGEKTIKYDNFLSYIDIPVMVYVKLRDKIELYGGVNAMIFTGGTAGGTVNFESNSTGIIDKRLDYSYNTDDERKGDGEPTIVSFRGRSYSIPETLGAYYDFDEKDGRAYNTLDFGVNAGVNFYFNEALFIGGRVYYGLSDVTNNDLDIHQQVESGGSVTKSDDKDQHLSFQVSLGFSF